MSKLVHFLKFAIEALLLTLLSSQGFAQEGQIALYKGLDQSSLQELMRGGPLLLIDESAPGRLKPATVGVLIEATPEQVWDVITDYEGYSELIPTLREVKVLEREANTAIIYFEVVVFKVGLFAITTHYTLKMTFHKPDKIIISWVKGKVKDINGSWELIPIEGGAKTAVFYTISGDYREAVIGAKAVFERNPDLEPIVSLSANIVLAKAIKRQAEVGTQGFAQGGQIAPYKGLDQSSLQELMRRGPFLLIDESAPGRLKPATVGVLINASPEIVWNVITDYEGYVKLSPFIKKAKVLEREADTAVVYFKLRLFKIGPFTFATNYTVKMTSYKPDKVMISWVKGRVKDVSGSWELIQAEGGRTFLFYTTVADYRKASISIALLIAFYPDLETVISLAGGIVSIKAVKQIAESL